MERARAISESSSNTRRGWFGLGSIMSTGIGRSSWSSSRGATDRIAASPRPIPMGRSATVGHLLCQLEVGIRTGAVRIVMDHRFTETWCFADADVARDDRVEHQLGKVL